MDTFAAFKVTFTNGAASALRRVFLNGTATNFGGTDPVVVYDSFIALTTPADTCKVGSPSALNTVSCILTDLAPGAKTEFIVVFKAPTSGARIDFNWTAGGSEGRGDGKGCCSQSSPTPVQTTLVDPITNPSFKAEAKTFVKPTGGTVFTGNEAITTESDGWSTTVVIPGFTSRAFTEATIKEVSSADPTPPSPQLACPPWSTSSTCFATTLTIAGTFDALDIRIRLDKSFFNLGRMDPAEVPLYYRADPLNPVSHRLLLCSVDEKNLGHLGPIPLPGRPCLSKPPTVYPNGYKIKELRGDLEFNVRARDNGVYEQ